MAYILREHWGQVFGAGNVDTELLDLWLKEVFPDGGNGRVAQGLPCKRSRLWRLRRGDIAEAIKSASKSMPGPDGTPYQAWRALGPIGVELLFEAAEALESTDCGRLLQEAESVSDELGHSFNLGLLCRCLPQNDGPRPDIGRILRASQHQTFGYRKHRQSSNRECLQISLGSYLQQAGIWITTRLPARTIHACEHCRYRFRGNAGQPDAEAWRACAV